ncbi:alpha/beta hydrolase [Aphanizomenon sp. UHCC 0183]|nr:alpha/beta hydrolase [Aphanizomenon sp. UHCC 0183]
MQLCQPLSSTFFQLPVVSCQLSVARIFNQLPITHYPLPITHYPLPITHYPINLLDSGVIAA